MTAPVRARLLLAEDEAHLAKAVTFNLEKAGFEVVVAIRGDAALKIASSEAFDLILLDIMMPGMDGFEVCAKLREQKIHTPILMLTARSEVENRIRGIELGADDYLGKPFDLRELIARIESLLRRKNWIASDVSLKDLSKSASETILLGEVIFDTNLFILSSAKPPIEHVSLTAIESKLLLFLISQKGKTIARSQILQEVWGLHQETQTRTLDNFIMRLRQHFEKAGGSAGWIESVRGIGYRFNQ